MTQLPPLEADLSATVTTAAMAEAANAPTAGPLVEDVASEDWSDRSHFRLSRTYLSALVLVHLTLPLAFLPWCFSWTGVALFLVGNYVYSGLGISLCFHRLFSHRSVTVPKWLERILATIGVCNLMETPARYAANHRVHHRYADEAGDPHSPRASFFWGHFNWLVWRDDRLCRRQLARRFAQDIMSDPYYARLERGRSWLLVYLAHAALYFLVGAAVGTFASGRIDQGVRFGTSLLVWGVLLRTIFIWHTIWAVNSITHRWGYRNFPTRDNSRNNWWIALLTNGEGWHNNHHGQPANAKFSVRWWEIDVTYLTIRLLKFLRLATEVKTNTRSG